MNETTPAGESTGRWPWPTVVLVLLALVPAAYLFVSGRQQRADLAARATAAEGVALALADSLDAARTQLLVDRVLALRDQTIAALTRQDPAAQQLIEEIASLHLPLGDPALGARIPVMPPPEVSAEPVDTIRRDADTGTGIDTFGSQEPS